MCVNGMFVALELKKSKEEDPDLLQEHILDQINKAQGLGLKVSPENWPEVFLALKALSQGEKINDRDQIKSA
jgi:hypothetical protein